MRTYLCMSKNQVHVIELDDEDYDRLIVEKGYKYYVSVSKKGYVVRAYRFEKCTQEIQTIAIHNDIIGRPQKGFVTDHRDRNPLNNQKYNIWHCTKRQNGQNRRDNVQAGKHPGVVKLYNGYRVEIRLDKKRYHIGHFREGQYELACRIYENVCRYEKLLLELVYND